MSEIPTVPCFSCRQRKEIDSGCFLLSRRSPGRAFFSVMIATKQCRALLRVFFPLLNVCDPLQVFNAEGSRV